MRFVTINSVCKVASTGSIAYGLHSYLTDNGHESIVCYGRGEKYKEDGLIKIESDFEFKIHVALARLTGLQGYFSNAATTKLLRIIRKFNPDAVFLLNLHGYYLNEFRLLNFLKKNNIRVIYIMPDEYPFLGKCTYSGNCLKFQSECNHCEYVNEYPKSLFFDHSKKIFHMKQKIYEGYDNMVFVSPEFNISKAKTSMLLKGKNLQIADWGIDLINTYCVRDRENVMRKYNIPKDKQIILTVGSYLNDRKGIKRFFFECAKQTRREDLVFINVGFDGDPSECPTNMIPINYVNNQIELSELYSCADLFVCTSLADTMPLTCLISLGCGTPICCFDISGLSYLADNTCADYVEPGNMEILLHTIEGTPFKNQKTIEICRAYAMKRYLDKDFFAKLLQFAKENMNDRT